MKRLNEAELSIHLTNSMTSQAMKLIFLESLTINDAARVLNLSSQAVRNQYGKVKKQLESEGYINRKIWGKL